MLQSSRRAGSGVPSSIATSDGTSWPEGAGPTSGAHQMGGSTELLGGQRGADPVSEALPVTAAPTRWPQVVGATPA